MDNQDKKNPFQNTMTLPTTSFAIRANPHVTEPALLARWQAEGLYEKSLIKNKGNKEFILHDGPPYANGHIHLGTSLNKCLKDFVCKSKRMAGYHVPLVLGFDCHGLPIELKVTAELGIEKDRSSVDPVTFKKQCRAYAQRWIDIQREEFKDLGVVADYTKPYVTMEPVYEASIIRAFGKFVADGYIERKGKTVPWCSSCQTVLAGAEIEYQERKDPSCYILFPLDHAVAKQTFPFIYEKNATITVNVLIWTTTPWTIPLNRGVMMHPTATYVVLQGRTEQEAFIVAKDLADKICALVELPKIVLCEFDSIVLANKKLNHPCVDGLQVPIIFDLSVSLNDGTACVHTAPGCGPDDYIVGIKNGLEIYSPLAGDGTYTKDIQPAELSGMNINDGQIWVMRKLAELNRLFYKTSLRHSYPHCWRCRNGLMFRATDQWFCSLQKNAIVDRVLEQIQSIDFVPEWGRQRLQAFVQSRTEWCISRQRQWGVPITALVCTKCQTAQLDAAFIAKVADRVEKEGIEYWDRVSLSELQEHELLAKDFACNSCGNQDIATFAKEHDILDVWFDSGVSNYAVLKQDNRLRFPADMYFEGSDQHRGWFQSSLFCSMILNNEAYAKTIVTHGYVVDEKKHKMSKSIGNVIAPQDVIKNYSRDILRLWVASSDYESDIVISEKLLKNMAEVYRKIRNTCRFMLSNLYDFNVDTDSVPLSQLLAADRYILASLGDLREKVLAAYEAYNFSSVVQLLNNFCANDLSGLYLDIAKDRLYLEKATGLMRRSSQTVLNLILEQLIHLMAPIMSFTAEELATAHTPLNVESVHLRNFPVLPSSLALSDSEVEVWQLLAAVRTAALKNIEIKRQAGIIKHSLESNIVIAFDKKSEQWAKLNSFFGELTQKGEDVRRFCKDWLIVSSVVFADDDALPVSDYPWLSISADRADGIKCLRCWQWDAAGAHNDLCSRCAAIL